MACYCKGQTLTTPQHQNAEGDLNYKVSGATMSNRSSIQPYVHCKDLSTFDKNQAIIMPISITIVFLSIVLSPILYVVSPQVHYKRQK